VTADTLPPMAPRPFRVVARRRETADTVTLRLEAVDGAPMRFAPGQFDMLYAFGIGEVPISFSGARGDQVEHTIRDVGAVTRALCASRRGTVLGARGPFGTGWPVEEAEGADVVFVGGGIGLAPLRPAIEAVLERRVRYGRVAILVGARSPDLLLYRRDLASWAARADVRTAVTVDAAGPGWDGHVGLVTELIPRAAFDAADTVAMVCGPEVMMRFVASALLDRGVDSGHLRVSLERNMQCGIGHCGHCQLGPAFLCKDGPVYAYDRVADLLTVKEL
jgi:NAD(P)H-flavin reductase